MPHFLIADDEPQVRSALRLLLESQPNTCVEAGDMRSIVSSVRDSESADGEPFDLILMDYHFGGNTGLQMIEKINQCMGDDYCEHRFVVVTGADQRGLAVEFAKLGAIGHLNKPINEVQFWSTIDAALTRRELFVERKADWESALQLLNELGILEGVESLQAIAEQYATLKAIHENLLNDLQAAGQREQQLAQAYNKASQALQEVPITFESIYTSLHGFGYTSSFLDDVKQIFRTDRLHFFALQTYLQRIQRNPQASMIKALTYQAPGHYEYRVGRNFRLYFRRGENTYTIFERFGQKTLQPEIINYLSYSCETDISEKEIVAVGS